MGIPAFRSRWITPKQLPGPEQFLTGDSGSTGPLAAAPRITGPLRRAARPAPGRHTDVLVAATAQVDREDPRPQSPLLQSGKQRASVSTAGAIRLRGCTVQVSAWSLGPLPALAHAYQKLDPPRKLHALSEAAVWVPLKSVPLAPA